MKSQAERGSKKAQSRRVFAGLSGGVDSSVSAALLQKAGYDVTGVFIKVWQPEWLPCTWRDERRDAMRVAAHLGIPFKTLDLEKEYKKEVVDYMIAEYKAGRTPNPDVMCNKYIKFGGFYDWAIEEGADFVATGHYAQVIRTGSDAHASGHVSRSAERALILDAYASPKGPSSRASDPVLNLVVGLDANKDQSYFLWTLQQEQLKHILFPVGHLQKSEVRVLANKFKLPTAVKKDSQGICFVGMVDMKEFLSHYIESKVGNVLNTSGEVIGTHNGAVFFTIGERHGFTITKKSPKDGAYFVVSKDVTNNTITVEHRDEVDKGTLSPNGINKSDTKNLKTQHSKYDSLTNSRVINLNSSFAPQIIQIKKTNWIGQSPLIGKKYYARGRYRQELCAITIDSLGTNGATITFEQKMEAITPGQSLVIYDGEACLGGGVIE